MEKGMHNGGSPESRNLKNIYARGADDGLWLGLYITVIFALLTLSLHVPLLNVPALAMILGMPFLTYFFLRRTHIAAHGMTLFSALWMQGIMMFACASLIFGVCGFIYLRWINPSFMVDLLETAIGFYRQAEIASADMMADELQMIIDSKAVPRPITIVLGWMWLSMFTGSLLSMLVAAVVKFKKVKIESN